MTSLERRRPETCLSDLRLDRLLAGELEGGALEESRAHLASCTVCAARLAELEAGRAAFVAAPPPLRRRAARRGRRWLIPSAATALAAAAAVLVVWHGQEPGTRVKGGERLGLYVKHGEAVRRAGPDEVVRPGDALRFTYSMTAARHLAVLSRDGAGHASVYYPVGPSAVRHEPGAEVPLPSSTVLDEVLGHEVVYGLFCAGPVVLEPVRRSLEARPGAPPAVPGCTVDRLAIVKERAP